MEEQAQAQEERPTHLKTLATFLLFRPLVQEVVWHLFLQTSTLSKARHLKTQAVAADWAELTAAEVVAKGPLASAEEPLVLLDSAVLVDPSSPLYFLRNH